MATMGDGDGRIMAEGVRMPWGITIKKNKWFCCLSRIYFCLHILFFHFQVRIYWWTTEPYQKGQGLQVAVYHDDVIKWKHFLCHWPFVQGRPVTRCFDVFLICASVNSWVNTREAGDLRLYHAHYDIAVMWVVSPNMLIYIKPELHGMFVCPLRWDMGISSVGSLPKICKSL